MIENKIKLIEEINFKLSVLNYSLRSHIVFFLLRLLFVFLFICFINFIPSTTISINIMLNIVISLVFFLSCLVFKLESTILIKELRKHNGSNNAINKLKEKRAELFKSISNKELISFKSKKINLNTIVEREIEQRTKQTQKTTVEALFLEEIIKKEKEFEDSKIINN